jgi:hypothetical protein
VPSELTTRFSASFDKTTKIISAVVCIGLLVAAVAARNLPVAFVAIAIVGIAFAFSPRRYIISNGTITVERLFGDAHISLEGISLARTVTKDDLRGCIRLWGNGGLFGYYGLFRTRALGVCSWYVTNRKHGIVVKTASKTVLFSPDDLPGFLASVKSASPPASTFLVELFTGSSSEVSGSHERTIMGIALLLAARAIVYVRGVCLS